MHRAQAAAAGGALWVLNGNHETMNVGGNFRYATAGADVEMAVWRRWLALGQKLRGSCMTAACAATDAVVAAGATPSDPTAGVAAAAASSARQFNPVREAALRPGGPIARRFFAPHPTVLQVRLLAAKLFCAGKRGGDGATGATRRHSPVALAATQRSATAHSDSTPAGSLPACLPAELSCCCLRYAAAAAAPPIALMAAHRSAARSLCMGGCCRRMWNMAWSGSTGRHAPGC